MLSLTAAVLVGPGLVLLTALLLFALWYPKRDFFRKGLKIPGPVPLPIVGNLIQIALLNPNGLHAIQELCIRFNGFCAIWQGHKLIIMISDPKYLKALYTNLTDRAEQFDHTLELMGPEALFASSGDVWRRSRKRFMMTFSPTPVSILIENYSLARDSLMASFEKHANGPEFQSWQIIQRTVGESMIRTTLGEIPHKSFYSEVADELDVVMRLMFKRQLNLLQQSNTYFQLTPTGRKYMKGQSRIKDWCMQTVLRKKAEYEEMKRTSQAIPNLWIFNIFEKFPNFDMVRVADDLANLIVTGMETTTNGLGYQILMLALHPELQEKVYQEDQHVQEGLRGRVLTLDDLEQYEFLDRFMKESLRLFPIGELIGRKLDTDTYFGDYLVPKRTNVMALPLIMNRDARNFPEPNKFDPDRWLPENIGKIDPFLAIAFGYGPRSCPGSKFAMIGLRIVVTSVLRKYHIRTSYKNIDEVSDQIVAEPSLTDMGKFPISLTPRVPSRASS